MSPHRTRHVDLEFGEIPERPPAAVPPCPVDRLPRRRRNRWCLLVITLGALNFIAYTIAYAGLGGDAVNGERVVIAGPDGARQAQYFLRGHHLQSLSGRTKPVSRGVWIYSYIHSITVWITAAAMVISMLVLARPHILATMRDGWISGQTFVTAFGTSVILITAAAVVLFMWDFLSQLLAA